MNEFKVGDRIVYLADWDDFDGIMTYDTSRDDDSWNHKNMIRKATTEEIAAGHRIDMPSLPKPIGSLQELHPEFAKVLHENFLELLGDDSHIENHISTLCEVKNHEAK
ncbi:TPA: hypothetical protein JI037_00635 [Acinetobacter baumannii]|nr:hypothetical protein [Acinetobacter baumannii]HAV5322534.1 hypothetical protein [Acinetobacter baumannii]HAV5329350.1 hypothetical protein [Acinetobacter baumannii]HAV5361043.1 hypothetical protein [Acinetobacter baumannii]HAV5533586.1 hypothetical protein [Acinetobacter baumannii]